MSTQNSLGYPSKQTSLGYTLVLISPWN